MSRLLRTLPLAALLFSTPVAAQSEMPSPAPPPASDPRVDALAAEVARLKESLVVPETEALRSRYGLGPAASKVYGRDGLSIGGYGEFFFGHSLGDAEERKPHSGDTYRFITYLGYKFDEKVVMNTELEFEHATTEPNPENGETGAVSVEFMYLDFLLSPYANVRAGLVLMPVGFVNEMHEPTTYRGNFRPSIERRIIPSTWREAGVGVHGETPFGLSYDAYMVSGLSAKGFGGKGARGGRQHGNHFVWEDKAFVLRLDYAWEDTVLVGGSFYTGGADQDPTGDLEVTHTLYELHAQVRARGAQLRALYARNSTSGADDFAKAMAEDPATATLPPEAQQGFYVEATYDVLPLLQPGTSQALRPFARFEKYDLNAEVSAGATKSDALDLTELSAGLEYLPNPDVVVKGEYNQVTTAESGAEAVKTIRVGAGFIF